MQPMKLPGPYARALIERLPSTVEATGQVEKRLYLGGGSAVAGGTEIQRNELEGLSKAERIWKMSAASIRIVAGITYPARSTLPEPGQRDRTIAEGDLSEWQFRIRK